PRHDYTRALQKSIPAMQQKGEQLYTIPGLPPNLSQPIVGCAFCNRMSIDHPEITAPPTLVESAPNHWVQDCKYCATL
ncbi:MAG: oligopeptide/dipeptide ABC transporter ATP-binding protein, partial [Myxococcota bacterium]